jgi:predicted MFS family arabinose efflux permease
MAMANMFTMASISSFFLLPLFITHHGGTEADIGILMAVFTFASILSRPWLSEMIDRIGRKRSYSFACMILVLTPLVYPVFKGALSSFYVQMILVRIVHGIGLALSFTAVVTYISDIIPKNRLNEGIGMFGVTALISLAMGPVFAELIIRHFGFSVYFFSAGGLAFMGFLCHLPVSETFVHRTGDPTRSFFSVLSGSKRYFVLLLAFLFGFGMSAIFSFVAPFAEEKRLAFISLFYIFYSAGAILMRLFGGRLADRVGEERIIPWGFAITGCGLLSIIPLDGNRILMLSGLLAGSGHGLLYPCLNALAIRNESADIRGKIIGIFTGGLDAGIFIGSMTLGYAGQWFGFQTLFLIAGLPLLAGMLIFRFQSNRIG